MSTHTDSKESTGVGSRLPDYETWRWFQRNDPFHTARPCWKIGRLLSVQRSDGHVYSVRPEDGLTPSEARER